ncbi:unnamed protein product [Boreogadus saida]
MVSPCSVGPQTLHFGKSGLRDIPSLTTSPARVTSPQEDPTETATECASRGGGDTTWSCGAEEHSCNKRNSLDCGRIGVSGAGQEEHLPNLAALLTRFGSCLWGGRCFSLIKALGERAG